MFITVKSAVTNHRITAITVFKNYSEKRKLLKQKKIM